MRIDEPVILVRIPRAYRPHMGREALYEATRKWWVIGSRRNRATYALAVADGVVRAAYRIDSWQKHPTENRWAFAGSEAPELQKYVDADVREHFRRGAQNPIRYLNC